MPPVHRAIRPHARLALLAGALALVSPLGAFAQATPEAMPAASPGATTGQSRTITLPGTKVFPEGIAYDEVSNAFFAGSTTDGTIFRGHVVDTDALIFIPGEQGRSAVGMKADTNGHLFVAGGATGVVTVYDTLSGAVLATFQAPAQGFLNDLTIAPNGDVYVTDSQVATIYRIPAQAVPPANGATMAATPAATDSNATPGVMDAEAVIAAATPGVAGASPVAEVTAAQELEAFLDLTGTAITYQEGFNLNGIVAAPDGSALLTVQSNTGKLYRIDLVTNEITEVAIADGGSLPRGDGLVLDGQRLYVVHQGQVTDVLLNEGLTEGRIELSITDESFNTPTTAALARGCLLVVNSQFANRGGTPELPFTVSALPAPNPEGVPDATACQQ